MVQDVQGDYLKMDGSLERDWYVFEKCALTIQDPKQDEKLTTTCIPYTQRLENRAPRIGIVGLLHEEGIGVRPTEGAGMAT